MNAFRFTIPQRCVCEVCGKDFVSMRRTRLCGYECRRTLQNKRKRLRRLIAVRLELSR